MIDVSQLPAVQAQIERDLAAKAGAAPKAAPASDEPPPRQFPLANQPRPGGKP
jgi:hypothetical protein